jgi:hypothetical protein
MRRPRRRTGTTASNRLFSPMRVRCVRTSKNVAALSGMAAK